MTKYSLEYEKTVRTDIKPTEKQKQKTLNFCANFKLKN